MKIRAVTFDLWLTLIWDTEELNEYWKLRRLINLHRFLKRRGHGVTFNDVRLAVEGATASAESIYKEGRDISPEERSGMIFEALGIRVPKKEAEKVYPAAGRILSKSGYFSRRPNLNAEARPTLEKLKRAYPEIKIGLISNAARSTETYRRLLDTLGIGQYFDTLTISCEVGVLKPAKEIFEVTLRALSVEPRETIHVGDLFKADVVGATSVGMNAALYTGLWDKYAGHHHAREEHIPRDFRPPARVFAREIERLQEVVELVGES